VAGCPDPADAAGHVCYVWYGSAAYHSHRVSPVAVDRSSGYECSSPCSNSDCSYRYSFGARHCAISSWDSYSALFSPLPQVSLFQSPSKPTLPSEAAASQQQQQPSMQQAPPQPHQQTQPEHTTSPLDDGDDGPSRFIAMSCPPAP
jgi:hypothetical protein